MDERNRGDREDRRNLEGIRVLLVEDDPDTREVLTLGLEIHGASVVAVHSAAAALAALRQRAFDVMLSDIGLPDEDGLMLMRRIRTLSPRHGGRVPAAAVTAFSLADDPAMTARAGFQRQFRKPVDTRTLFRAVADLARLGGIERRHAPRRGGGGEPDDLARAC